MRRLLPWAVAWVLLTAAGTALHWGAWIAPAHEPPTPTFLGQGVFKHLGNFMTIVAAPGWIAELTVAHRLYGVGVWQAGRSFSGALIANGIGWALGLWLISLAIRARERMTGERAARLLSARANAEAGPSAAEKLPGVQSLPNLSRRRFVVNTAFAGAGLGGAATMVHASTVAPWELVVARYTVAIADLPAGLDGLKIVQIADTHLGPRVPAEHVRKAMRLALSLKPDVLALNGDYVHNGFYQIAPATAVFAEFLPVRIPVVGVLGNHDWYADARVMSESLTQIGVRMIDNDRVYLDAATRRLVESPTPECLCLAGLGDLQNDVIDPAAALDGVPETVARVVLAHNPDTAEAPEVLAPMPSGRPRRIDLMLSGHTHGGQVSLPLIGTPIVPSVHGQKYAHGLVQGPVCKVVISAGVGVSLVPVRFGVPPEVVEITLKRP